MDFSLCKTVTGVMRNQGWLLSSCLGKKTSFDTIITWPPFRYQWMMIVSLAIKPNIQQCIPHHLPLIYFFFMFGEYFRISNNSFGRQKQNPSDVNLNLKEYSENITMNPVEKQSSQSMKVFYSQKVLSIVKTDSMSFWFYLVSVFICYCHCTEIQWRTLFCVLIQANHTVQDYLKYGSSDFLP